MEARGFGLRKTNLKLYFGSYHTRKRDAKKAKIKDLFNQILYGNLGLKYGLFSVSLPCNFKKIYNPFSNKTSSIFKQRLKLKIHLLILYLWGHFHLVFLVFISFIRS